MDTKCSNRLGAEYGEDNGPCGDEGHLCEECEKKVASYWAAHFGLRPGMTREQRRAQLEAFRPEGLSVFQLPGEGTARLEEDTCDVCGGAYGGPGRHARCLQAMVDREEE